MIAMVLGLLLLAAVGAMFLANKRNDRENSLIAEMQLNARFALGTLTRDLSMAGFYGGLAGSTAVDTSAVSASDFKCGDTTGTASNWVVATTPLAFIDNVTDASATYPCLDNNHVVNGTDVIAIHRSTGVASDPAQALKQNTLYLSATHTTGDLFVCGASNCPPHSGNAAWAVWGYKSHVYFIRDYAHQTDGGIHTLCRKNLAGQKLQTECIAAGVENMQLTFGVDTDDDGSPDQYMTAPNPSQIANVVTLHIQLLMRSPRKNPRLTNNNCYTLQKGSSAESKTCFSGEDSHYYGRVVQQTVRLRNLH